MKTLALTETVPLPRPTDKLRLLHYSPAMGMAGLSRMAADVAGCMQMESMADNLVLAPNGSVSSMLVANGIPCRRAQRLRLLRYVHEAKRVARHVCRSGVHAVLLYGLPAVRVAWLACRRMAAEKRPLFIAVLPGIARGFLAETALNFCDAVVVNSRTQRQMLLEKHPKLKVPPECIWVIPYGVDELLCHPHFKVSNAWKQDWERRHPQFHRSLSLCIPGSISPVRGLEYLPDLVHALGAQGVRAHAYLAGDVRRADESYISRLKKLFRSRNLESSVTWLDPRQGMREIMGVCDITLSLSVHPAVYDRAILEALSLGRPVVGFDHGAVGEMLNTFLPEGRVSPADLPAMVDTLVQWNTYRPDMPDTLPYPYRLTDTAQSLVNLCRMLQTAEVTEA